MDPTTVNRTAGERNMDRDPAFPPPPTNTLTVVFTKLLRDRAVAAVREDALILPAYSLRGTPSIEILLDVSAVFSARCEDATVIAACNRIRRDGDLVSLLDSFQVVQWDDESELLVTYSRSAVDLADQIRILRDCALALVAYAAGFADGAVEMAVGR